ncbi:10965_t:CDS:2 [Diversispora eburnea]|uniref:Methionine synthase reductase n=2 Tax=Diversisporales TaxID=214509 RepID=A0A9N9FK86_9GLOM|nr:10965_t:CDS:2 [Diversispora eburnea]
MSTEKSPNLVVFYGSQTGNAEWIAKNIHEEAIKRGFSSECYVLNEHDKTDLSKQKVLIFVTSSTGDGDPPDNSTKFFRYMRKIKSKTFLSHAKFTILGLGDTNYSNFNNTAKRLEKRLLEFGASPFYTKGLADDAVGLELVVDSWIANLWDHLAEICTQKQNGENGKGEIKENGKSEIKENGKSEIKENGKSEIKENGKNEIKENGKSEIKGNGKSEVEGNEKSEIKENGKSEGEGDGKGKSKSKSKEIGEIENPEGVISTVKNLSIKELEKHSSELGINGNKIILDLSELANSTQLTALPRVPIEHCKIIKSNKEKKNSFLPSFIITPNPIINAKLNAVRCLTRFDAIKKTLHLELDIKDHSEEIQFFPGDAFGIIAPNDNLLVQNILTALGINENESNQEISVEHIEKENALLRMMAEYTSDDQEKKTLLFLCSKQGVKQFNCLREQIPTLLDLLVTFPSCKPPVERLLDVLPAHQPRYYSIVNSPLVNREELHFAFNIIDYYTPTPYDVHKFGVCTPWLNKLSGNVTEMNIRTILTPPIINIPIFMKSNSTGFKIPSDLSKSLILIGPGTGVAPFVGFLQHREKQIIEKNQILESKKKQLLGETWLFYGCREKEKDFLYHQELEGFLQRGILKELLNLMRIRGSEIFELLSQKEAMIFVCGDAKGMAKDVNDALTDILVEHGKMQRPDALNLLVKWMGEKRYLRDLWA